jgi:peptide/nickel transport system ATP-binding protein
MSRPVLDVQDLTVSFQTRGGLLRAVDGVSFSVSRGEVLGLVGESGSGKSVTSLAVMGLLDRAGRIERGSIRFEGEELVGRSDADLRALRGKRMAMIFQDPMSTLNPVQAHERVSQHAARDRARQALARVGIPSPEERLKAYPHQFSGGMRQRVAIAIALLHGPSLIMADEPTTALDVTIQAQILCEVQKLASEMGTALVWVTHDLSVVASLADRVAVMYAGRLAETGSVANVLEHPLHPYTAGLIGSVPSRNRRGEPLAQIPGTAPSLANLPSGCRFRPRCGRADAACHTFPPSVQALGQQAFCHHPLIRESVA